MLLNAISSMALNTNHDDVVAKVMIILGIVCNECRCGFDTQMRCEHERLNAGELKHTNLRDEYECHNGRRDAQARRDRWRTGGARLAVALPCDIHRSHRVENRK